MPIPITITLNSIVGTPGLFNLYSNTDSYTMAFETGVSASGNVITSTNVPNGTTIVKIKSTGVGCNYEITKSIVGLPTVTPLPPTVTPLPATVTPLPPTPTPCPNTCSSSINDSYEPSDFHNYGNYCLDLSSATNGATITIAYQSYDRPNRYTIYENGITLKTTSGWVGDDNTYGGAWGSAGQLVGVGDGSITFTYDNTKTYTLKVECGAANPLASPTPNPSDAWNVTITCGEAPSPTASFSTSIITAARPSGNAGTLTETSGTTITVINGTVTIKLKTWVETGYRSDTTITVNGSSISPEFAGQGATPLSGTGQGNASFVTFPLPIGVYTVTDWTVSAISDGTQSVVFAKLEQV
jgi:hypothetical protein